MATRCLISKQIKNNTVELVYCHFDGGLNHVGNLLKNHYDTQDKLDELLKLGDLSFLEPSIEKPEGHTFSTPLKGYSIFYGRDRGEEDTDSVIVSDWSKYFRDSHCAYIYIFKDDKWYYSSTDNELKLL